MEKQDSELEQEIEVLGAEGDAEAWVIQDVSSNSDERAWFWKRGRSGYTPNLDEAHRFTKGEAVRICAGREDCDKPWRLADIEGFARRYISVNQLPDRFKGATA